MARKILFFINPVSGTHGKNEIEKKIVRNCNKYKIHYEILSTTPDGVYPFLSQKITTEQITDVVICGGDGSLSPIVSSLFSANVNFGIIPAGSGNGMAFSAKIPKSADKALDIIFQGKASYVDAFIINGHLGCMLCGIGLDAQVAYDFSLQAKRGLNTYLLQSLKNFVTASSHKFKIEINDTSLEEDAFFVCIANSNQFGNNFTIAPQASLCDGLLDVIIVKKTTKLTVLWALIKQVLAGQLTRVSKKDFKKENILYLQAEKLRISNPGMAPLHIDGDPAETAKAFDIKILPKAFRLIQPQ
ncbi:MAG: YegS/Rv2252/BmrU family lipid kinase [Ginsengibacter sp.]